MGRLLVVEKNRQPGTADDPVATLVTGIRSPLGDAFRNRVSWISNDESSSHASSSNRVRTAPAGRRTPPSQPQLNPPLHVRSPTSRWSSPAPKYRPRSHA